MSKFSKFRDDLAKAAIEGDKPNRSDKKESSVFTPGQYEVTIKEVIDQGLSRFDDTWASYRIVFENSGGKRISSFLNVPLESTISPSLDGSHPGSEFRKLTGFLKALGLDVEGDKISTLLGQCFEDPNVLVDAHIKIDVGYRGLHAEFVKESKSYVLLNRQNERVNDESYSSRDELRAAVQQDPSLRGFKDFPDVLKYQVSTTKNEIGKKTTKKISGKIGMSSGL